MSSICLRQEIPLKTVDISATVLAVRGFTPFTWLCSMPSNSKFYLLILETKTLLYFIKASTDFKDLKNECFSTMEKHVPHGQSVSSCIPNTNQLK